MASSENKASVALAEPLTQPADIVQPFFSFDILRFSAKRPLKRGHLMSELVLTQKLHLFLRSSQEPFIEDEYGYFEENSPGDSHFKVVEIINCHPVLLIATADTSEGLPPAITRCFSYEIKMDLSVKNEGCNCCRSLFTADLFIIGASNRPDLIDPALLRPGRFDKLLYVGVNSEASYRERVLKALTRKFKLHEHASLSEIAQICPPNFTGADMYALCADALFRAAKNKVLGAGSDSSLDYQPDSIVVEYEDFVEALRELSPSLCMAELKKYELLRD